MRFIVRFAIPILLLTALVAAAGPATAAGTPDLHSPNMHHIAFAGNPGTTNSDLAFWGNLLYEGSYTGFRILDISNPHHLREAASYMPDPAPGAKRVSANDVYQDDRGLIYLIDRLRGLHIVERT